jgi:predicted Zn-dependent protease
MASRDERELEAMLEYLDNNPGELNALQRVAEIYTRLGDFRAASECYFQVGSAFLEAGQSLRAAPMLKAAIRLDTSRLDAQHVLAELYVQMGLVPDALVQLQLLASFYERAQHQEALGQVLVRMVEVDPDNVAGRIRLAEWYVAQNAVAEAVTQFEDAALFLKRANRIDDYVKVAERLVYLDPSKMAFARELAQIYLAQQDTQRALVLLQICFKDDPRDIETLNLLAQSFLELGQTPKAVQVYKELARIYDENDQVDEEREIWGRIRELSPDDPDLRRREARGNRSRAR